jgi:hypothetical protein
MIIESAQMLANAYSVEQLKDAPRTQTGNVRRYSYLHHPCSKWVLESKQNFDWLLNHAIGLADEKWYRTGKKHFTLEFLCWCDNNPPNLPDNGLTPHAQAMPEHFKNSDFVKAYKDYYNADKVHLFKWTKRNKPQWIIDNNII